MSQITRRSAGRALPPPPRLSAGLDVIGVPWRSKHPGTPPLRPDSQLVWNFPVEITFKSTNAFGWPQLILSVYEVVRPPSFPRMPHCWHACPGAAPTRLQAEMKGGSLEGSRAPGAPFLPDLRVACRMRWGETSSRATAASTCPLLRAGVRRRQIHCPRSETAMFGKIRVAHSKAHFSFTCRFVRRVHLFKPASASLLQHAMAWAAGKPAEYTDPRFPARNEGREVTRVESVGCAFVTLNVMTKDMGLVGYSEAAAPASGGWESFR